MNPEPDFIFANGQRKALKFPCTVAEFVATCGFRPTQVVVEHNGEILARGDLATRQLRHGDHLEMIVPVAGG